MPTLVSSTPSPTPCPKELPRDNGLQGLVPQVGRFSSMMSTSEGPSICLVLPQRLFPWQHQMFLSPPGSEDLFSGRACFLQKKWLFRLQSYPECCYNLASSNHRESEGNTQLEGSVQESGVRLLKCMCINLEPSAH